VRRREALLVLAALGVSAPARADEAPNLPLASDLRKDGLQAARARIPIVVLFSLPGCPYCSAVRRSHLLPMLRDPKWSRRLLIRQLNVSGEEQIIDFSGRVSSHGAFARAQGVRVAPVVVFWNEDGREIAGALRGMLLPDFYSAYLESAIELAESRQKSRS
jgi:thioredoxin-related protein